MRRRAKTSDDSLDLLLDTMCNAFGGIVLIAILVALLVEPPGKDAEVTVGNIKDAALRDKKEQQLSELTPRVEEIESELEETGEIVELIRVRDAIAAALSEKREKSAMTTSELNEQLLEAIALKKAAENQARDLGEEISMLEQKEENLEKQIVKLEEQEKDLVDEREQELRPPQNRETKGSQVNFIIRYGAIYPLINIHINGSGGIIEATENQDGIDWRGPVAIPMPGKGLVLPGDKEKLLTYLKQLSLINKKKAASPEDQVYAIAFVFGDSFDTVLEFRELVAQMGNINDGWEPWPDNVNLAFGADGSSSMTD